MSEAELSARFADALTRRELLTKEGIQAAQIIAAQADREGIECALAGGIAMHVHGYLRATEDVDLLASAKLALPAQHQLSFGGESYLVEVGERSVTVDVIVRDDFFREFYAAALHDAVPLPNGLQIISAEWMAILKFLAGRSKDILDLLWLLQKPGLVDRAKIARLLEEVAGITSAQIALRGLEPYYLQAEVMRAGDENGN